MTINNAALTGMVIRADGTVPFDDDCPEDTRNRIITYLVDNSIPFTVVPNTKNLKITDYTP